jgi:hypothetical protein
LSPRTGLFISTAAFSVRIAAMRRRVLTVNSEENPGNYGFVRLNGRVRWTTKNFSTT